MIRSGLAAVLIGTCAMLGGCSAGYYVNLAEIPQRPTATERTPARAAVRQTVRAVVPASDGEATGSIARAAAIRPWPKRGTAEWNQIQKDELEREKRITESLRSICRGC
jgi:hypothetical protein